MIIAKFGGTSVASKAQILTIVKIVKNELHRQPVLVVSAVSGVTDSLLSLASATRNRKELIVNNVQRKHQILIEELFSDSASRIKIMQYIETQLGKIREIASKNNLAPDKLDELVSFGEIISSFIIHQALISFGINSQQVNATKLIVTDDNFQNAEFLPEETEKQVKKLLKPLVNKRIVPVVTGFIGATKDGQITTLGRGGSDYTASIIGYSLRAEEIQIWTDVDGIKTADPRIVKDAKTIELISYKEAAELAILGAKVLYPKTIFPAVEHNIPVKILNTFNPSHKGTAIVKEVSRTNHVTAITCHKGIKMINIYSPRMYLMYGFLYKVFKIFDEMGISVDFVSTSEVSVSLTVDEKYDMIGLAEKLRGLADVEISNHHATVSVVGRVKGTVPLISGRIFSFFEEKKIDIEMISAGASKVNETVVIKEEDADEAVRMLHRKLITNKGIQI